VNEIPGERTNVLVKLANSVTAAIVVALEARGFVGGSYLAVQTEICFYRVSDLAYGSAAFLLPELKPKGKGGHEGRSYDWSAPWVPPYIVCGPAPSTTENSRFGL
jgi:hypothetical protein